jgi:hypothetical protein
MARIAVVFLIMNLNALCTAALQPHFASMNLASGFASGETLSVPDLAMDFIACEAQLLSGGMSVVYEARAHSSSKPGIRVLSVGLGQTEALAAGDAASQWALGVLPVITSYIRRTHVCDVEKVPMIVAVAEEPERYGWTAHLGPVIARAYGGEGAGESLLGDLSRSAAYTPIFRVVHPYAAHRSLMWVESFASKYYSEGKVDATCRLRNNDFPEGRDALLVWAQSWPATGAALLSKRQFILFESTPVEQLESSNPKLLKKLNDEMKQRIQ